LQHEEHETGEQKVGEEEPAGHQPPLGEPSRKPTARTVSIQRGSPSFFRNEATWTSSVLLGPYQCESQTSSMIRVLGSAAPASSMRRASRSNSRGVSSSSRPAWLARRERRSSSRSTTLDRKSVVEG